MKQAKPILNESNQKSCFNAKCLIWILRIAVALQFFGYARLILDTQFTYSDGSSIFALLSHPYDVQGLEFSEAVSLKVDWWYGVCLLAAGVLTLIRPCLFVLLPMAIMQLIGAYSVWRLDGAGAMSYLAIPENAMRILAPIILILVDPWKWKQQANTKSEEVSLALPAKYDLLSMRWRVAIIVMCCAAGVTFYAHGHKAIMLYTPFENLIASTLTNFGNRFTGEPWIVSQSMMDTMCKVIGIMDIGCAVLLIVFRFRAVAYWMAIWGMITAISRMTSGGFTPYFHETLIRSSHAGIPLVIALYWAMTKKTRS